MQKSNTVSIVAKLRIELFAAKSEGNNDKAFEISQKMIKIMADAIRAKKAIQN